MPSARTIAEAARAAAEESWHRTTSSFAKSTRNTAATGSPRSGSSYNGADHRRARAAVALVGGWRYWEHVQETQARPRAYALEEALELSRDGSGDEAQKAFESAREGCAGRATGCSPASALPPSSARATRRRARKRSTRWRRTPRWPALWQDLARLRAAMLRLDTAEAPPCVSRSSRLPSPTNAWRHSARELLGLSGLKAGDMDTAGRWFDQIAADRETPPALRQRLAVYTALVAGGSGPECTPVRTDRTRT